MMIDEDKNEHIEIIDGKPVLVSGPPPEPINLDEYKLWLAQKRRAAIELAKPPKVPKYIDLLDMDQIPPLEILSDELPIPKGGYGVVFGPPGGGKSFWAIDRAMRLASTKMRVLYIAGEGLSGYKKRAAAIIEHLGIKPERGYLIFKTAADNFLDREQIDLLIDDCLAYGDISLVVVDTLARTMIGGDENNAGQMGEYNAACMRIQTATGAAVMPIHHTGKAGGTERGSSALRGAADTMFDISSDDDGKLTISCSKQKDAEPFKDYFLQRVQVEIADGETSCILQPTDALARAEDTGLTDAHIAILQCLGEPIYAVAGATFGQIKTHTGIKRSERTISRYLGYLKDSGYLDQPSKVKSDPYVITEAGRDVLARELGGRGLRVPDTDF